MYDRMKHEIRLKLHKYVENYISRLEADMFLNPENFSDLSEQEIVDLTEEWFWDDYYA